jgi:hypothetical protein
VDLRVSRLAEAAVSLFSCLCHAVLSAPLPGLGKCLARLATELRRRFAGAMEQPLDEAEVGLAVARVAVLCVVFPGAQSFQLDEQVDLQGRRNMDRVLTFVKRCLVMDSAAWLGEPWHKPLVQARDEILDLGARMAAGGFACWC